MSAFSALKRFFKPIDVTILADREALSKGNESWARYPCGRNADDVQPEQSWSPEVWIKYCDMIRAYARKIQKLLAKGWTGPYGHYGTWTTNWV